MRTKSISMAVIATLGTPLSVCGASDGMTTVLEEVIVTAPQMREPLTVVTDPKAPRQPLPAHDGADYLKSIPGFSVIRKGGTDGDPVLRGMAGSRLNILLDGEQLLGGCGMRMDPPTSYVFPEAYDRITVIKGPQTVLHGPGNSAGAVLFERDNRRFAQSGWKLYGGVTLGSFGRNDVVADLRAGTPDFYVRGVGTYADSDNYKDGDGRTIHSRYTRWSGHGALGWTPDDNTRLELRAARSDGEAAYADRTMDGVKFERDNVGLTFQKLKLSSFVDRLEAQVYYNYIDHVMDNFTLRTFVPSMMMPNRSVNNPDRETIGGRLAAGLRFSDRLKATVGIDHQANKHTLRSTMNQLTMPYESMSRREDASFRNSGLFGELKYALSERDQVVGGMRADNWHAVDKRASLTSGSGAMASTVANPTSGKTREETLYSGFGRYERDLRMMPATFYAGIGHVERFPDYWELISFNKESATTLSAFDTKAEKTTQLDIGLTHSGNRMSASLAAFYNRIDDFILIQSNFAKGARTTTIARNVDATSWGGEAGIAYAATPTWKLDAAIAYVRGTNETDGRPLAQLPPLEGRLGATYDRKVWSLGALLRLVAAQDRFAVNQGNIVGQDIGRTAGFAVFSVNAGWRPTKNALIAVGVDNLFDRTYAEHISRSAAAVPGFLVQTTRVNEPGRTFWVRASVRLD